MIIITGHSDGSVYSWVDLNFQQGTLIEKYTKYEIYEYFIDNCCICEQLCNETSGYKCMVCNKAYCDAHNDEKNLCDC